METEKTNICLSCDKFCEIRDIKDEYETTITVSNCCLDDYVEAEYVECNKCDNEQFVNPNNLKDIVCKQCNAIGTWE